MTKKTLNKLKNAEHLLFGQQFSALLTELNHEKLNPLHQELKTLLAKEEEGQKQIRANKLTESLVSLDKKRDELYSALKSRIDSEEKCPVEERKKAAKSLRLVLKTFGNPIKLNFIEATSIIKSLIIELKQSKYETDIKTTGMTEWISWLETANTEFFTIHEQRRDELAETNIINVKSLRKELDVLYTKIFTRIMAISELEPSETITAFISKMNTTIEKYKALA